ncbi:MAG TPA: four helix bundle protein [Verrucomicrobiae bacterium]|nr:four helix bundle protein [Verrucomicrobiae bacterium]
MAIIRSFRDLRAYQEARSEANRVFEMTKTFPKEEKFSLTDQIRRSSRSVKSMIAEAWGHRRYPASFVSKLTDAIGEANETQSWLDDALDCRYIPPSQHREFDLAWQSIGGMIANMIIKADDFCRSAH